MCEKDVPCALAPLWGANAHGPYAAFDDPTQTEQERLDKERMAMGLLPPPAAAVGFLFVRAGIGVLTRGLKVQYVLGLKQLTTK